MYGKHNAQSFLESLIFVWNAKLGKGCVTVRVRSEGGELVRVLVPESSSVAKI